MRKKPINNNLKYFLFGFFGLILIVFLIIITMAIFRLCPPIESGPQPPWCINEERFDKDFQTNSLISHLKSIYLSKFPGKNVPDSFYDPSNDNLNYFDKPIKKSDYNIMFGIAHNDFSWPVCRSFNECIVPEINIFSTFSRAKSIGADFIFITDYANNNLKREIYDNKVGLSKKIVNKKLEASNKNNLSTMVVTNLFIDDKVTRHIEYDEHLESQSRRFGSTAMHKSVDNWAPNEDNMNKLFDSWEKMIIKKAKTWQKADYFIINPEDTHLIFMTHPEIQNKRYKNIFEEIKKVYNGNICFILKNANFFNEFKELNFYENADCLIIEGHFKFSEKKVEKDINSLIKFFDNYFSNTFFENNKDKEIFIMISAMSYDKYLENSWFEGWDYEHFNLEYEKDFRLQATIYEALFRSIQKNEPPIAGVLHYGYWWEDVNFDDYFMRVDLINSIRNKDAEHIYYRWSQVLK
jgi:hypothetical protein